jgi:hypothetical protein
MSIRKRPVVLTSEEHIRVKELETINQHFDAAIGALDRRQLGTVAALDSAADLPTAVAKINEIIAALTTAGLMT